MLKRSKFIVMCIVSLSLFFTSCTSNNSPEKSTNQPKQSTTQVKKVDHSAEALKNAEMFFSAFARGDAATASKFCYHEKRIIHSVSKEEYLSEASRIFAGAAEMYSRTTGIKTGFTSNVSTPQKADDNHYKVTWTFSLGGDRASIPDITLVKVNEQWFVDFESFAIPFNQMFAGY